MTVDAELGYAKEGQVSVELMGIEPIPESERYGHPGRLFTLWFAPQLTPATFFIGALGPAFGLGFTATLLAILVANLVGAVPVAWLSTWGPPTGMAQLPLSRTAFGRSVKLPAILNWATCVGWQAFDNVFASTALNLLLGVPLWVGVLLVFAGQLTISVLGYEVVHQFARYMSWVLGTIFVILTFKIVTGAGTTDIASQVSGADLVGIFFLMVVAAGSFMFTWTPFAADYSRYLPADTSKRGIFLFTLLGLFLSVTWMEILGLLVANKVLAGGVAGASETIRDIMGGGFLGAIVLIAVYLGIVAVNSIDDYSGSLSLQAGGVRLKRPVTAALTGVVAFCASLFFLYASGDLAGKTQNFLLFISYWISAWFGVILVDWVRRKGRVDVYVLQNARDLHFGAPALTAMILGFVSAIPFSNTTFGYNFVTSHPDSPISWLVGRISTDVFHGADLGFFVGFVVAAVVYVLLDRRSSEEMYLPATKVVADRITA